MASIGRDRNGRKRVLFVAEDGSRKTICLGKCSVKQALAFKVKLEALIAGRITGSIDDETARWVASLPNSIHKKLATVGLVDRRTDVEPEEKEGSVHKRKLGEFIEEYIRSRTDIKPGTATVLGHTQRNLLDFFGPDKPLPEITEGDADGYRLYLIGQGLAENTVRRRCGIAKQFFKSAVRHRLIGTNPFADLKSSVQGNKAREYFLGRQDTQKVLDACPDAQWRLIFALARFGGLRCTSEVLTLRWCDVDWESSRITVHSPKTEHHQGRESREIPLFPELLPYLREAFEQAEPGTEYVITRYRQQNVNLRTQLHRIIHKAGLQPWPKLFQNLRSTRETELTERWPEHVVCAWIGNSKVVAREHYLQVTDEHFERAALCEGAQNPHSNLPYRVAQSRNERGTTPHESSENVDLRHVATECNTAHDAPVGRVGFEPT